MSTARVLVVDDSAAMRAMLTRILSQDPGLEVVGGAADPAEARTLIKELNPDVLTLDVEMPGMDGLTFLERIMRLRPMPVVMCSTLTARGTEVTIEALRLGAVDCIAKPSASAGDLAAAAALLCRTVRDAAQSQARPSLGVPAQRPAQPSGTWRQDMVILVGASTGGVEALFTFLGALPPDAPPVVVVQHMPAGFTAGFADRLDKTVPARVVHGFDGAPLRPGQVLIAPGGDTHAELAVTNQPLLRLRPGPLHGGHRPAVDCLFSSAVPLGPRVIGVLLTGMGRDGADGLLTLRDAGAATFAQSADSCVVFGMPRAAIEIGAATEIVPLSRMADAVLRACRAPSIKD
jgi:two-component system chemotaxis response regulator CheB